MAYSSGGVESPKHSTQFSMMFMKKCYVITHTVHNLFGVCKYYIFISIIYNLMKPITYPTISCNRLDIKVIGSLVPNAFKHLWCCRFSKAATIRCFNFFSTVIIASLSFKYVFPEKATVGN